MKEQISQALKAHQTLFEEGLMLRSGSSTPASHLPDTQVQQTQLTQLLKQGKVTAAFQQARIIYYIYSILSIYHIILVPCIYIFMYKIIFFFFT